MLSMNSDLIVMTFEGVEMAESIFNSIGAMRESQILGLDDAAIVTNDGDGRFKLRIAPQAKSGLAGLLAHLLCSPDRIPPGGLSAKMDDEFVAAVQSAMRKSGSALLFNVHPDSLSDTYELLDALALFRGTIHQTTLSPQSRALLREML
jgi:uncharacterized membrane protein